MKHHKTHCSSRAWISGGANRHHLKKLRRGSCSTKRNVYCEDKFRPGEGDRQSVDFARFGAKRGNDRWTTFTDQVDVVMVQNGGELPEVEQLSFRKVTLWTAEDTVTPPNESANVQVITNDNYAGGLIVDLSVRSKENEENCIPRFIMNTRTGTLPVNLSNPALLISK